MFTKPFTNHDWKSFSLIPSPVPNAINLEWGWFLGLTAVDLGKWLNNDLFFFKKKFGYIGIIPLIKHNSPRLDIMIICFYGVIMKQAALRTMERLFSRVSTTKCTPKSHGWSSFFANQTTIMSCTPFLGQKCIHIHHEWCFNPHRHSFMIKCILYNI